MVKLIIMWLKEWYMRWKMNDSSWVKIYLFMVVTCDMNKNVIVVSIYLNLVKKIH